MGLSWRSMSTLITFFLILRSCWHGQRCMKEWLCPHTFAVFSGSMSSGGAGILAVLTAQNWQPRVHVSPARYAAAQPAVVHTTITYLQTISKSDTVALDDPEDLSP